MTASKLQVMVDGEVLAEDEGRQLWGLFSAYMEAHRGDFDGFARSQGKVSASTGLIDGVPTLTLSSQAAAPPPPRATTQTGRRRGGKGPPRGRRKR